MIEKLRSSVRPIVTYGLTGAVIYGFIVKLIPPEVFMTLATMAFTFWFVDRVVEKRTVETAKLIANEIAKAKLG